MLGDKANRWPGSSAVDNTQPAINMVPPPPTPTPNHPPSHPPSTPNPTPHPLLLLIMGYAREPTACMAANRQQPQPSQGGWFQDSSAHGCSGKGDSHHYDIVAFVPGDVMKDEDSIIACSDRVELTARVTQSKCSKLSHGAPAHWSAANSTITVRLIRHGVLGPAGVNQYLRYSFKVGGLGRIYNWSSILQYDCKCCLSQAMLGFAWGT